MSEAKDPLVNVSIASPPINELTTFQRVKERVRFLPRRISAHIKRQRKFIQLRYWVLFLVCLSFLSLLHPRNKIVVERISYDLGYGYSSMVNDKKDLINSDITTKLKFKNWKNLPFDNAIKELKFVRNSLPGFVSNLDVRKFKKVSEMKKDEKKDDKQYDLEASYHKSYDTSVTCKDLLYENIIEHSETLVTLEDDLIALRRDILKGDKFYSGEVKHDNEKDMSEEKIISEHWLRFGGSPVYLEEHQCYLVFSRLIYSDRGFRGTPKVSLIRAQAFDKNWNEIKDKRIPYDDVIIPSHIEEEIERLERELGMDDCSKYKEDQFRYDECMVNSARNKLQLEKRKSQLLDKYYLTYPTILEVPFITDHGPWRGPEDPHAILKKGVNGNEVIVVFNMYDNKSDKRKIFAMMPHKKVDPIVMFSLDDKTKRQFNKAEKNWTPFFHYEPDQSALSRGSIHFIYTFSPLEILKCSLNDGLCEMVFEAGDLQLSDNSKFGGVRGGTQYMQLPPELPRVNGKQMWVGFPKVHIGNCGCGSTYYRPMLSLLIESNGVYHQELVVPSLTFDMDVISWDLKDTRCGGTNILSPNSIAYWEIIDQDPITKKFEDYMAVSVSEADSNTKVVVLRGILNYILGIYSAKDIKSTFEINSEADAILGQTLKCMKESTYDECKRYGQAHK